MKLNLGGGLKFKATNENLGLVFVVSRLIVVNGRSFLALDGIPPAGVFRSRHDGHASAPVRLAFMF